MEDFLTNEEEKRVFKKLLSENKLDKLDTYIWDIRKEFYYEELVDIETFLFSSHFLGETVGKVLYPIWVNTLKKIHSSAFFNSYYEIILQVPIGSGKSYIACASILYEIYKLMLLYSPQEFYGLGKGTKIFFVLLSATLNTADINWNYIKEFMELSPFFSNIIRKLPQGKNVDEAKILKDIWIGMGSGETHTVSRTIFGGALDENDFNNTKNRNSTKNYENMSTRIESRFANFLGIPPGVLWLLSSPTFESSFTQERIMEATKTPTTLVLENLAKWDILRGSQKFFETYRSKKYFPFFAGDKIHEPKIISKEEVKEYKTKDIIYIPLEHKTVFTKAPKLSLRDLAGKALTISGKFISDDKKLDDIMSLPNRLKHSIEIIPIGSKIENRINLIELIDKNYFSNPNNPEAYRYGHIDMGYTQDAFSISFSYGIYKDVAYYSDNEFVDELSQRFYMQELTLILKAVEGDRIPQNEILKLISYLKSINYPIKQITSDDKKGSAKILEDIETLKIDVGYLSMDRYPENYYLWRTLFDNDRLLMQRNSHTYLEYSELVDKGKNSKEKPQIDHPKYFKSKSGIKGSKDSADSSAGAIVNNHKAKVIYNSAMVFSKALTQYSKSDYVKAKKLVNNVKMKNISKNLFKRF